MPLSPETERALELCYHSIAAPQNWAGALDELAHSLGATACQVLPHDMAQRCSGVLRSNNAYRISEQWQRNVDWVSDVYVTRGAPFVSQGVPAVIQSQLFSDDEIRTSRFHQEITGPVGCLHWACGMFQIEDRTWCLPFYRGNAPFTAKALAPIAEIAARMSRIVGVAEKVYLAGAENEVVTLETAGCAAVAIDRTGRVIRSNRRAEDLFCSEFGLRRGKLWTASDCGQAALERFTSEIERREPGGGCLPRPIVLVRQDRPWLMIEAMPVTSAGHDIFEGCRAILIISDLTRPATTDTALLCLLFGLTNAEARLAAALCHGYDLHTAAATFGISLQTARSQLKAIFSKTGCRRQAELVARVSQLRSTQH